MYKGPIATLSSCAITVESVIQSVWWMRVDNTHSCPQFWCSKKNSNSTQFIELYFGVSEQIKQ